MGAVGLGLASLIFGFLLSWVVRKALKTLMININLSRVDVTVIISPTISIGYDSDLAVLFCVSDRNSHSERTELRS